MVRLAKTNDLDVVTELAALLWNEHSSANLEAECSELITAGKAQFFLKYDGEIPAGFAQCQLRHDYVEGTSSNPVGYLEGIFVRESYRHRGYARELLEECKKWAKANGCQEFASDCELNNEASLQFHRAMHFTEANRIICFVQEL